MCSDDTVKIWQGRRVCPECFQFLKNDSAADQGEWEEDGFVDDADDIGTAHPLLQPTSTAGRQTRNRKTRRFGWEVISLLSLVVAGGGIYWYVTAEARLERAATESFQRSVYLEFHTGTSLATSNRDVVELEGGHFARRYYDVIDTDLKVEPSSSAAYPFTGTITQRARAYSTISHRTMKAAEKDEKFYQSLGDKFYSDSRSYQPHSNVEIRFVYRYQYDKLDAKWRLRDKGKE
jgi:hypothetical protein